MDGSPSEARRRLLAQIADLLAEAVHGTVVDLVQATVRAQTSIVTLTQGVGGEGREIVAADAR